MGSIAVGSLIFIVAGLSIAWVVFRIIADWKVFTKAGEAGWKTLIPFYNVYTQFKISMKNYKTWFWVLIGAVVINSIFAVMITNGNDKTVFFILYALTGCVITFIEVYGLCKLAEAFNRNVGFMLGLVFLEPIFIMILGFGDAEYVGIKE